MLLASLAHIKYIIDLQVKILIATLIMENVWIECIVILTSPMSHLLHAAIAVQRNGIYLVMHKQDMSLLRMATKIV